MRQHAVRFAGAGAGGTLDRRPGCCDKSRRNVAGGPRREPMKAILCTRFGGPDDLELRDIPDPAAGTGEVVVAVKAAALNFFDTLIIAGKYQHKPPFPFSPAAEFSGVIENVGTGVTGLGRGDLVLGHIGAGAAR